MQTELRARIKDNTDAGGRVDWGLRPQGKTLPAIRLTKVSNPRGYTMDGPQVTQQYRVQADCYGSTYKQAKDLGDELIALLEPASGNFQASFVMRDDDAVEQTDTGPLFSRSIDFKITHIPA
jgi:hypothetical protein